MQNLIALCKKYREQLLYLIFGGLTTLVDWVIRFALYHFWLDQTSAPDALLHVVDVIAWIAAVTFAYVTNRIWVFESKKHGFLPILGEIGSFAGGRVATLLIQEIIMFAFVTQMGLNKYLFTVITAVLVIILNYVFSKLFVFRKNKHNAD